MASAISFFRLLAGGLIEATAEGRFASGARTRSSACLQAASLKRLAAGPGGRERQAFFRLLAGGLIEAPTCRRSATPPNRPFFRLLAGGLIEAD